MNPSHRAAHIPWWVWAIFLLPVWWAAIIAAPVFENAKGISAIAVAFIEALNHPFDLIWIQETPRFLAIFSIVYGFAVGIYLSTQRNTRPGEEHGSALWGDARQLCARYRSKQKQNDLILTQNFHMGLDGRKHRRNLNVLVVGGSGAGKTRFYAKPNVMQANCSYIISDPKGELLRDTGHLLVAQGYEVRVIDLINPAASHGYNPFAYVRDDKDVLKLITNLVKNTTPKGASSSEPFWEKSEIALLQALMLYLIHEAPEDEQNFAMVMDLLRAEEVREDEDDFESVLDVLFAQLEYKDPDHLAVKQYKIYKMAAGKTAKSILISVGVRLSAFNLPQIASLTSVDEMDLGMLGERKQAIFCCIPDNDTSFNFLVGMLYTAAFQELYYRADRVHGGRLPVHVHCVMDEWANVALPESFEQVLATMRSREISVSIIVQNIAQIKALYEKSWESIIGNCDELLYLGGNEQATHKYVSELLGKQTIDTTTHGQTKGKSGSYSSNFQNAGRELLTADEVRMLDNRYALLFMRGERPIIDSKYDILKHPNIALTPDGGHAPFIHDDAPLAVQDVSVDMKRFDDYELLDIEDILDEQDEESENNRTEEPHDNQEE